MVQLLLVNPNNKICNLSFFPITFFAIQMHNMMLIIVNSMIYPIKIQLFVAIGKPIISTRYLYKKDTVTV